MRSLIFIFLFYFSSVISFGQTELLVDGNFTNASSQWNFGGNMYRIQNGSCPSSPSAYAYFGTSSGGYIDNGNGLFWQDFSIPSNATSCNVSFKVSINTYETSTTVSYDEIYAVLEYPAGPFIATMWEFSNLVGAPAPGCQTYSTYTYNIPSTYFGQNLRIRFYAISDGASPTIFRIDDVSILATVPGGSTGSVRCSISPSAAVSAGAQWNIDGGAWTNSGTTISAVSVGQHTINFKDLAGWTKPNSQIISVSTGSTANTTGTYQQALYSVSGKITNSASNVSGVQIVANPGNYSTTTNALGEYSISLPGGWSGGIKPNLGNTLRFTPYELLISSLNSNLTNQNFAAVSSIPSQISIENVIPYLSQSSKNLWAGTTAGSVYEPIKICADGSQATKITFTNYDPFVQTNNIRFWINSDRYGINTDVSGYFINYEIIGNRVTATFAHPKYLDASYLPSRNDVIEIVDINSGVPFFSIPMKVFRAPVLFVHGFIGDRSTFADMEDYFYSNNLYSESDLKTLTLKVHYEETSTRHFIENKNVVKEGIDNLLSNARTKKYSAGKVIIVAHSMGGILSRLYLQSSYIDYRGDIAKLITLNTPHYGTQFANVGIHEAALLYILLDLFDKNDRYTGAIQDMQAGSQAISTDLNIPVTLQNKVASATIASDAATDFGYSASLVRSLFWIYYLSNLMFSEPSDLIVPISSQKANLNTIPVISGQWHIGAAENNQIKDKVKELINANPQNSQLFTANGFPQGYLTPPILLRRNPLSTSPGSFTDSIEITYPMSNQLYSPEDSVDLSYLNPSHLDSISLLVYGQSVDPIIIKRESGSDSIIVQVPLEARGKLKFILLGGDSTGWRAIDSVHINITSNVVPDSIRVSVDSARLALGLTDQFEVLGYFQGLNEPVVLNADDSLRFSFNMGKLIHEGQGKFRAVFSTGRTSIIYNYKGRLDSCIIDVYNDPTQLKADFITSQQSILKGEEVVFYNKSIGQPLQFRWSFPGGVPSSSTSESPVVIYPDTGVFSVKMHVTFINGLDSLYRDTLIHVTSKEYKFIGNGDWNTLSNWENSLIPPTPTPKASKIIIDNISGGEAIINDSIEISHGSTLIVNANKKLIVNGNLAIKSMIPDVRLVGIKSVSSLVELVTGYIDYNGEYEIIERGVCFGSYQNPDTSNTKLVIGMGTGAFEGYINRGLSFPIISGYYARAFAIYSDTIVYSNQVWFSQGMTTQMPTFSAQSSISKITLNSASMTNTITCCNVLTKGVCWSIMPNPSISDFRTVDGFISGTYTSELIGLMPNTTYFVRAYATYGFDNVQYGPEKTFTTTNSPYYIGQEYGGGLISYIDSTGMHGLIKSVALSSSSKWIGANADGFINATDTLNGFINTYKIMNVSITDGTLTYAAKLCKDYQGGGYNDWYLPSVEEMRKVLGGSIGHCWTSTEVDSQNAVCFFLQNTPTTGNKSMNLPVIAVRKF